MLVEFSVENFGCFKEKQTLSMVAGTSSARDEHYSYNTGHKAVPRLLKSAAIFGPNASGKTTLLNALNWLRRRVTKEAKEAATFKLDDISRRSNTVFSIVFIVNEMLYRFTLEVNRINVVHEQLERIKDTGSIELIYSRQKQKDGSSKWESRLKEPKGLVEIWQEATRDDALFLNVAVQLNSNELKPIYDWFLTHLLNGRRYFTWFDQERIKEFKKPEYKKRFLDFINVADVGMADILLEETEIRMPDKDGDMGISPKRVDFGIGHYDDKNEIQYFDLFSDESSGTSTLFDLAADFFYVLDHGALLLVDELDDSLHPHLVTYLVNYFNDPVNNPKGAQLIFTSHDVTLLRGDTLHPDQIWLCEKRAGQAAHLFPLSTYKVRKGEAKEDRYLAGRYGGLPRITKTYIAEKLTGRRRGKV